MSKHTESYKKYLLERLQDPEEVAGYLNAALEEGDISVLLLALRDVAEARGVGNVAAAAKLNRENVYRILSDQGNPRLSSLCALLHALDIELEIKPRQKARSVAATVSPTLSGNEELLGESRGNNDEQFIYSPNESLAA